ncbi:MAG: hypothetical protein KF690_06175 [Bacteroidetes bacterium]|nr:hypothetical protein [Bacteroidota bacterium]
MVSFYRLCWGIWLAATGYCHAQLHTDSVRVLATNTLAVQELHDQPQVLADNAGGMWVTFTATRGPQGKPNVVLQHLDAHGQPLLPADGLLLCPQENVQAHPRLVPDGEGGLFVIWEEQREYLRGMYGMRLNRLGEPLWQSEGEYLAPASAYGTGLQALPDGQGGCYLTWEDIRAEKGQRRIFVQKIASYGLPLWQFDGLPACPVTPGIQQKPQLDLSPDGGIVVLWEDFRSGAGWQIFAQKFSATGEREWPAPGIAVTPPFTGMTLRHPRMKGDGFGGLICTYEALGSGTHGKDIYLCRVSRNGRLVYNHPVCETFGDQFNPRIVLKGADAYIWWEDLQGTDTDIYCQQVDIQTGKGRWQAEGVLMCLSKAHQTAPLASTHGVYDEPVFIWLDDRNGHADIFCQKMNNLGEAHWDFAGISVAVNKYPKRNLVATADGEGGSWVCWIDERNPVSPRIYHTHITLFGEPAGGYPPDGKPLFVEHTTAYHTLENPVLAAGRQNDFYIGWEDYRNGWRNSDLYLQRLDSLGQCAWLAGGLPVCNATGYQSLPRLLTTSSGCYVAWLDRRNGTDDDIYLQHMNTEGLRNREAQGHLVTGAFRSQNGLQLVRSRAGHLWAGWTDSRQFIEKGFDIYVARMDATGKHQLAPNGAGIATQAGYQTSPALLPLAGEELLMSWMDDQSGHYNIFVQKLDSLGYPLWGETGRRLAPQPAHQRYPTLLPLKDQRSLVTWTDDRHGQDFTKVMMQCLNAAGQPLWEPQGRYACECYGRQSHPQALTLPDGGWLQCWLDQRAEEQVGYQLMAQRFDAQGQPLWEPSGMPVAGFMGELFPYSLALLPGGQVLCVWQEKVGKQPEQVRYTTLALQNGQAAAPRYIWTDEGAQLQPRMAVQGRTAAICWITEDTQKKQQLKLRFLYF